MSTAAKFGDVDLRRLGLLVLAATDLKDLSEHSYLLIRNGGPPERREWRVNVRYGTDEKTLSAQIHDYRTRWNSLVLAVDRAVQWLAAARADPREGAADGHRIVSGNRLRGWTDGMERPAR